MMLRDLLLDYPVSSVTGDPEVTVRDIQYDSRRVKEGDLFCTWKGHQSDGHRFISQSVQSGASAVVLEEVPSSLPDCTVVEVDSGRKILAHLAAEYYRRPAESLETIAITGTNGKTSTAFCLYALLSAAERKTGLIGTIENRLGDEVVNSERTTPESLEIQEMLRRMVEAGCSHAVLETSSHALDQHRVDKIPFRLGVFTQLSQDHMDYHGTMENYFAAKASLFQNLGPSSAGIINIGTEYGIDMQNEVSSRAKVLTYAVGQDADHSAFDPNYYARGSSFIWKSAVGSHEVMTPWLGQFNLENVLAAMAAAAELGIPAETIVSAIATVPAVKGRLQRLSSEDDPFLVLLDYAHTPDAVIKLLRTLRPITKGKLRILIGCGGDRDRSKRSLMAGAAMAGADDVMFTSDNPRSEFPGQILDDMTEGLDPSTFTREEDRAHAIEVIMQKLEPDDVLVLAGKGHEEYQEISGAKHSFSDAVIAHRCLEEIRS
ncbi:MAG: UDP-N-acetylmuramoyl-L-alanyl-D-glutamate--2,6-diaminopimelate ligase [Verrucomicrobiota bacterium]